MKIIVSGRNIDLTKAIKDHVSDKFQRLEEHFDFVQEVHCFLSVEKNPSIRENQVAEATVHVRGAIVRVEVATDNLYTSIDELVRKVDRSLKKHKTKLLKRNKHDSSGESIRRAGFEEAVAEEAEGPAPEEEVFFTYSEEEEPVSTQ